MSPADAVTGHSEADVLVVGAGFAGVAAARELRREGLTPIVLEARSRIGGRTWFEERMGTLLELGGTWIHPFQPNVWSEVRRFGIGVVESPTPTTAHWIVGDRLHEGSPDALSELLDEPMRRFAVDAREVFPRPFEPLFAADRVWELDHLSVEDRLRRLGLTPHQHELMRAVWSLHFCAPCEEGGLTQALRWLALATGDWQLLDEICETFRVVGGTRTLFASMAAEEEIEIRPDSPVETLEHGTTGVVARVAGGSALRARAAVVTVPLGALRSIRFDPALSKPKRAAASAGQASRGLKLWARLRGDYEPFVALAGPRNFLGWLRTETSPDGGTVVVGFSAKRPFDPGDRDSVEAAVRTLLPDAHVEESTGQDCAGDAWSGEAWPMLRSNQLTEAWPESLKPEGPVWLAGSDYAQGWAGFIDGAIESGMRTARAVDASLGGHFASHPADPLDLHRANEKAEDRDDRGGCAARPVQSLGAQGHRRRGRVLRRRRQVLGTAFR